MFVMSYTVQAQENQQVIRIPVRVAKQIQQDLITKDSCETMLGIAATEMELLGRNIEFKDKMIDSLNTYYFNLKQQYENEKNMKITYKAVAEECKTDYNTLKNSYTGYKKFTKLVGFLGTAVIAGLTAVVLFVK